MFNILHKMSANYISFTMLKSRGNAIQTAKQIMKSIPTMQKIKVGDKVTFDNNQIELFKTETSKKDKAIQQYQQLVLGSIDQVGVVKELGENLTTVSYPDGWDLPVPTKYLVILP